MHLAQTEGSRMVMALCQSSYNQGVYGLVTNLGSLVVRTIFFPVEEAAFRAFSRPPGSMSACTQVPAETNKDASILKESRLPT